MSATIRKKSPRAPSSSLPEALDRALKVYEKDRLHPAPTEVFANNLGYKSANSGSALTMIASLRYFGLVERVEDGVLAITKAVESYKFAPDAALRQKLLRQFVRSPSLYSDLLDKYSTGLPSDANLRYELIQRGFVPSAAESVLSAFRESVAFANYFSAEYEPSTESVGGQVGELQPAPLEQQPVTAPFSQTISSPGTSSMAPTVVLPEAGSAEDRIPVRLSGGRRAWLVIPTPFFEADKSRLKAQIDLLLTQDEEDVL
ncbi:hypothetical protein [Dyella silvae]|uniref:hypothetical protein n=1 Tax=Dyella silvae TaxID=2994424 RepID=UPI0022642227|nr:hypothetical protein [Dyella silvae]